MCAGAGTLREFSVGRTCRSSKEKLFMSTARWLPVKVIWCRGPERAKFSEGLYQILTQDQRAGGMAK